MAVLSVTGYQIKPGRRDEFIEMARESKAIIEPLAVNLRSMRLTQASLAGAQTGLVRGSFEYDDLASWAATVEREAKDERFNALVAKLFGPDSPATPIERGLASEIVPAATSGGTTRGSVLSVAAGQVKPGRLDDYIAMTADINQHLLRSGALRARHFLSLVGGPNVGQATLIVDYADMNAFATAWQTRSDDPEWRALVDAATGADGPIALSGQVLATQIPL